MWNSTLTFQPHIHLEPKPDTSPPQEFLYKPKFYRKMAIMDCHMATRSLMDRLCFGISRVILVGWSEQGKFVKVCTHTRNNIVIFWVRNKQKMDTSHIRRLTIKLSLLTANPRSFVLSAWNNLLSNEWCKSNINAHLPNEMGANIILDCGLLKGKWQVYIPLNPSSLIWRSLLLK